LLFIGRLSQDKRGIGSIIGAVFLILILLSGYAFYALNFNVTRDYTEILQDMQQLDLERNKENIEFVIVSFNLNRLNLTINNIGSCQSHLIWLGIFNETVTPNIQDYYRINFYINPAETVTNVGNSSVDNFEGQKRVIQLVTELGNTFSYTYPPSENENTQIYDFVDNNSSDVDSSPNKGTHSFFPAMKAGPDGICDVLAEKDYTNLYIEHYVDSTSNVDNSADKGTHSNFNNQKFKDNNYDTLTEQNTGGGSGSFGSYSSSSYSTVSANQMYGSVFTSPSNAEDATLQSITWYGRTRTGSGNSKAVLVLASTKTIIAVSNPVSVSTTLQERTNIFSTPPTISANTNYILMMIFDVSTRFYYISGSANQGYLDTSNSYSSPTNPTDATNNNYQYRISATYNIPNNYELDLEEQFINVDYNCQLKELCIYTGALGSENLKVDVRSGSSWITIINALQPNAWNNVSVSSYLTSATFTIRFRGSVESRDSTQDNWQIDAVLVRTSVSPNCELDLEVQWTSVNFNEENEWLSIYCGTMGNETLLVDVRNGTEWINIIPNLSSGWNSVDVSPYLTSSTFTIRFKDGTEMGDVTPDSWEIDAAFLYVWTEGA